MANTGVKWSSTGTFTYPGAGTTSAILAFPSQALSSAPYIFLGLSAFAQNETIGNCTITFADATTLVLAPDTGTVGIITSAIYKGFDVRLAQGGSIAITISAATSQGTASLSAIIVDGTWTSSSAPTLTGAGTCSFCGALTYITTNDPIAGNLQVGLAFDPRYLSRTDVPLSATLPDAFWELETRGVSTYLNAGGFNTQVSTGIYTTIAQSPATKMTVLSGNGNDVLGIAVYEVRALVVTGKGSFFAAILG